MTYKQAKEANSKFEQYEVKHIIETEENVMIVRLDGHDITKSFKSDNECFNSAFYKNMYNISRNIINYFPYIVRTYSFKDEISIQIDYGKLKNDEYYKNREEKVLSILSGYVSSMFNLYNNKTDKIYSFDARILYLPCDLVNEYFEARKYFAIVSYFDRISSFYNLKVNGKTIYKIKTITNAKGIKNNDLKKFICYGINGKFDKNQKWIITPRNELMFVK